MDLEEFPDILKAVLEATSNLLPTKSKEKYEKCYELFCQWRIIKKVQGINEDILIAYFFEKSLCLITWASGEHSTPAPNLHDGLANLTDTRSDQRIEVWKLEARSVGWTSWSEWSTCSRSCDGGVSHQLRRCTSQAGCKGEPVRHKICNMQPCPEPHDFRDHQCASFNAIPYDGHLLSWVAHYDDSEACALTCRGRHQASAASRLLGHLGAARDDSSASSGGEEEQDDEQRLQDLEDDAFLVAQLAERVHDGTRCRPGSLDMCIDGKCRRVGCDLRIGSTKKVDSCGVCGGDGTSCAQPLYHWTIAPMSLCSVTCGGGYKMSRPVCQNRVSGAEVEQQLCNAAQKPDATVVQCNTHKCPPKWIAGEWGPCSVSCGGGSRLRQVQCVEEANNTRNKVSEHNCRGGHKPRYQEPCNQIDCPKWRTSPWSGCSVSCGSGLQVRVAECRDSRDHPSVLCPPAGRPDEQQPCATGIACPAPPPPPEDDHLDELLPGLYHTQPLLQPYPPDPPPPPAAERLVGEVAPSDPTFIAEDWGPCSVSCGKGIRKRDVNCKIFLEISRTIAKLPDGHCPGPKPDETETCTLDPCPMYDPTVQITVQGNGGGGYMDEPYRNFPTKYSWKEQGFTHCSASCLGGVQELIVNCVREDNQKVTSAYLCPPETKPQVIVRTCNEHPCPPRWNYSDFQPCTKSCGFGIQTREVNCIHEVSQGGGNNIVVIPNHMCPQPPPPDRQYCNVLDCPVKWHHTEWSKCSLSCGGGIKERKVECKQVMAQNHVVDRPPAMCPSSKPLERRPCNTKSCVLESDKPEIIVSNSSYIQHDPKKKKISVKIGGSATVFYGTMIKIKCHVKRYNRTKIQWAKDHTYLTKSKKFKISKKGALRIQNLAYSDSGVYTCMAGKSSADLTLTVKPKPGEFPSSEEIDRNNANRIDRTRVPDGGEGFAGRSSGGYHQPFPLNQENISHEQREGAPQPLPKQTGRSRTAFRPTMPPSMSHADASHNKLNAFPPHQSSTTRDIDEDEEGILPSQLPAAATPRPPLQAEVPSSAAARPLPHFQQLLVNLQTFSSSRGHRMVANLHPPEETSPGVDLHDLDNLEHHLEEETHEEDLHGHAIILGKGTADNLKFDWVITEWTECSQTCGGNGFQMRAAHCMVRLHNTSHPITPTFCSDSGLATPPTIRKCGWDACPAWVTSPWSPCASSRCLLPGTALQRRAVTCQVGGVAVNATLHGGVKCEDERPTSRRECRSGRCRGVWKGGEWSECAAACEANGVKYRILQCVWTGTKKPAGSACRDQPRPPAMKACKGPPCPKSSWGDCLDHSSFCSQVKSMNLCGVARYEQQCCQSCSLGQQR